MTVSETSRIKVKIWDSENDAFTRAQMNDSHQNIEDRAARFVDLSDESAPTIDSGTAGQYERSFHFRYVDDGTGKPKANAERGLSVSAGETAAGRQWYGLPPAGVIVAYAGSLASPPAGWLVCDGSLVLKADYPTLWALLGTAYGAATTTQFRLPNFQAKVIVGADGSTYTRGGTGGSEAVTLTTAQIPSHRHGPGESTGANASSPSAFAGFKYSSTALSPGGNEWWYESDTSAVTQRRQNFTEDGENVASRYYYGRTFAHTGYTGGSDPHSNMQPYGVATWIIKT